jgi:riboflavin kinase/FMN adenylyltransferase
VTNIGYRPTFGGDQDISIETFLLDPLAGEAPRRIRVSFLWRLRDERKFESPEALKSQIFRDVARTETYFRRRRSGAALL